MTVKIFLTFIAISTSVILVSCDGIFPTENKPRVPDDHTDIRGGFFHLGNRNTNVDECRSCHGLTLEGGLDVTNINNVQHSPSCYQCHGEVWLNFR